MSDPDNLYDRFWLAFIAYSLPTTTLYADRKPKGTHELNIGLGKHGAVLKLFVNKNKGSNYPTPVYAAQVYIDKQEHEPTLAVYDALYAQRHAIEAEVGVTLDWMRLDDQRASRIVWAIPWDGDFEAEEHWPQLHADLLTMALKLDAVFRPRLAAID